MPVGGVRSIKHSNQIPRYVFLYETLSCLLVDHLNRISGSIASALAFQDVAFTSTAWPNVFGCELTRHSFIMRMNIEHGSTTN